MSHAISINNFRLSFEDLLIRLNSSSSLAHIMITFSIMFVTISKFQESTISNEFYQSSSSMRQFASLLRYNDEWDDTRPLNNMKSIRSQVSTIKNKLEELANQAIAILLKFLCIFQKLTFSDDTTRLRFRCLHVFIILTYPVMNHLCRSLLFMRKLFRVTTMIASFSSDIVIVDHMNG